MATFDSLPTELLHQIAQYLAPTCWEDCREDILIFRLVSRQAWVVANRHAFKYMALHIWDVNVITKLGHFGQSVQNDPSGFDIRRSVNEIRFTLDPFLLGPDVDEFSIERSRQWFTENAPRHFAKQIGKKEDEDLSAEEQLGYQYYWTLFVDPCIPEIGGRQFGKEERNDELEARMRADMAYFPNVQVASVDLQRHPLDTKSESYRFLRDKGWLNKFWDAEEQKMRSFWENAPPNVEFYCDAIYGCRLTSWGYRFVYCSPRSQGWNFFNMLPSTVSKMVWASDHIGVDGWHHLGHSIDASKVAQITALELFCSPMGRKGESYKHDFAFPNLRSLKFVNGMAGKASIKKHITAWKDYWSFIEPLLGFIDAPRLASLHVKGFPVAWRTFHILLDFGALRDLSLTLEDLELRGNLLGERKRDQPDEMKALRMHWLWVIEHMRDEVPNYVNTGKVSLKGTYTSIHMHVEPQLVLEQTLDEKAVTMLSEFLRTGNGPDEAFEAMHNEAYKCQEIEVGDMFRTEFWQHVI